MLYRFRLSPGPVWLGKVAGQTRALQTNIGTGSGGYRDRLGLHSIRLGPGPLREGKGESTGRGSIDSGAVLLCFCRCFCVSAQMFLCFGFGVPVL
jgi:hypothetical protein